MIHVLQLTKMLNERSTVEPVEGILVRHYAGEQDIEPWLALRGRAFAREKVGVRGWQQVDFEEELLNKPWWSPERMWLAESAERQLVGAVALGERGPRRPVVHWLMVDSRWRRRGVGRLLMQTLEGGCWDRGHRQIWLETHADWQRAVALYQSLGYRPA